MKKKRNYKDRIKDWITKKAESPFLTTLKNELKGCKSVLDVGCGVNSSLGKIPKKFYSEGIDAYFGDKKPTIYDKYRKGNILNLTKYYKENSFDAVIAIDVIEHLKKKDGIKFMKDLESIARKKIIILTPSGFMEQGAIGGNIYMTHLSGWTAKEFKKRNYKTHGMHGIKGIRGDEAAIKFKPWYFWLYISHLSQHVVKFFPDISFHVIAIKSLDKN